MCPIRIEPADNSRLSTKSMACSNPVESMTAARVELLFIAILYGGFDSEWRFRSATFGTEYSFIVPDSRPINKILSEIAMQQIGSGVGSVFSGGS